MRRPPTLFVGVLPLLRTTWPIEARRTAAWVAGLAALSVSSILAFTLVYDDPESRATLAATVGTNPALSMLFGPARDLLTEDGFNAWRSGALGPFVAGLMAIFVVVRNSRADEDSGQAELLASAVMGRHARLLNAITLAWVASLAAGLVSWVATVAAGGGVLNSLLLSATFTVSGFVFAAVAAIAAQIGSDARSATTLSVVVIGGLYLLRGYLDASQAADWTSWLTPFGWFERVRPSSQNDPLPLLLALGLAVTLVVVAVLLHRRRDYGQGLVPPRRGPARAGLDATLPGFVTKLNAATVVAWWAGFVILGVVLGNLSTSIGGVLSDNPLVSGIIASGATSEDELVFCFVATILSLLGMTAAVFGIQIADKLYTEETAYRVEPLLATAVRRREHFAIYVTVALIGPALALTTGGAAVALLASTADQAISGRDVCAQAVLTIPAMWLLITIALAAVGSWPRVRAIGWFGVVLAFALTILGPMFELDDAVLAASPFWHVPDASAATLEWSGLVGLCGLTATLVLVGFIGYRRRDIA